LEFGDWRLEFGDWNLEIGIWKLDIGIEGIVPLFLVLFFLVLCSRSKK
jgi:hypothetical protein